jgi:hypothetical protein
MTKLKQQALVHVSVKQQVCALVRWTEEQYAWYLLETGLEYLQHRFADPSIIGKLEASVYYWNWFKNHWMNRDKAFVETYEYAPADDEEEPELVYRERNNARTLAAAIYPSGVIMKESCKEIIKELFNAENNLV